MNVAPVALEFDYGVVDLSVDSTTVKAGQCAVRGIYVNTVLSAHACPIKDDTVTVFTLPASLAAGTFVNLGDAHFKTSIVVDPDNAATGNITVIYKPAIG